MLVNAETEELFGCSREKLIGQPVDMLVPERFRGAHPGHQAGFFAAPRARTMGVGRELFALRKDGTEFPVEIGLSPIQTSEGTLVLTAIVDITARKQAEAETLRQRAELAHVARVSTMGELAASVAHELNQPLGAILANAEAADLFLNQDPPALDELRAILVDIRQDDERASEVIRRMRALLRKQELERLPLEINSVVEDVLQVISGDAALRKIAIGAELAPGLPKILGDRVHLQQVLLNLILNGMDAMAGEPRERRRLSIRTRSSARRPGGTGSDGFWATASSRKCCRGCSSRSTRPNPTAWAWGFRFPARLSKRTTGASGRRTTLSAELRFTSSLPVAARKRSHERREASHSRRGR